MTKITNWCSAVVFNVLAFLRDKSNTEVLVIVSLPPLLSPGGATQA